MKTIDIIGAGPGLGFSLAKTFGRHDFRVALVSRTQDKLNQYADQLNGMGIEAKGFAADITNKMQLTAAFQQIRNIFGTRCSGRWIITSRCFCWASIHQSAYQERHRF